MSRAPEILLMTEDTGDDSHAVLQVLCRKMLRLVDPAVDAEKVRLPPADEDARKAMGFHGYRDRKNRKKLIDLVKTLAARLLSAPQVAFALVHVDGDRGWSECELGTLGTKSEGVFDFRNLVLPALRQKLVDLAKGDPQIEAEHLARLDRLFLAVPYRHMEAWLYQNAAALRQIYARHHPADHPDLAHLARWEADPALLDEEPDPKETLSRHDGDNLTLAETFPARKVHAVGKSFTAAVDRMSASQALRSALAEIRYPTS